MNTLIKKTIVILAVLLLIGARAQTETLTSDNFEVVYSSGGKLYAGLVLGIAEKSYDVISASLDHEPEKKIVIHLTNSLHEFNNQTRNALPDWSSAASLSSDRIVLSPLAGKKMGLERIIPHEIVHCFINDAAGLTFVPRWFHEGMAEKFSGSLGVRSRWLLTIRSIRGNLLSFMDIQQVFKHDSSAASVAYDQSHLAVNYLGKVHGKAIYAEIIDFLENGEDFSVAFQAATGISQSRFEKAYLGWLTENYNVRTLLSYIPGSWTVILILAFVAFAATKLRNRRTVRRWEREERSGNIIDFDSFPPDE